MYPTIFSIFLIVISIATYYSVNFFRNKINDAFTIDEGKISIGRSINFDEIKRLEEKLDLELTETRQD